jgi:hypothetical protein
MDGETHPLAILPGGTHIKVILHRCRTTSTHKKAWWLMDMDSVGHNLFVRCLMVHKVPKHSILVYSVKPKLKFDSWATLGCTYNYCKLRLEICGFIKKT